jgi:hypothetical protein
MCIPHDNHFLQLGATYDHICESLLQQTVFSCSYFKPDAATQEASVYRGTCSMRTKVWFLTTTGWVQWTPADGPGGNLGNLCPVQFTP